MQLFLPVLMTGRARETSSEDLLLNSYIERIFFSAQLCTAAEIQSLLDFSDAVMTMITVTGIILGKKLLL